MASIQTSIMIRDGMSVAFEHMNKAMNLTLNTFESVHKATLSAMDTSSIQAARESIAQATVSMQNYERETAQAAAQQQVFTNRARESVNVAGELWSKVRGIAATIGGMRVLGQVVGLSDEMTQTKARLSMVVDDGGSVSALQQQIFESAQRSRSDYMGVADVVAKLSLRAGDAFSSNAETIQFAENLNKQFAIAGASQQEMYSASLQLTQALGSGVLRGEELNAVFEAAPNVIQMIADYLEVPIGSIREMASEGQITAEIVRNSMLSATDEINKQFENMPMTWGQVWTTMKNEAVMAFDPVFQRINDIANSEEARQFLTALPGLFSMIANAVLWVFDMVAAVANFIRENWSIIQPIVMGIVAALLIYKTVMTAIAIIQAVVAAIKPFTLVLLGVAAAIALFMIFTEQIVGAIYWVGALGKNVGLWFANVGLAAWALIQNVGLWFANLGLGIWEVLCACAENVRAAFVNAWKEIQIKFWGFVEAILQGVSWIADKVNSLLGVFGIEIDTTGLDNQIQSLADRQKELEGEKLEYRDLGEAWKKGFSTFEYKNVGDAFHTFDTFENGWGSNAYKEGAGIGAGIQDWIGKNLDLSNLFGGGGNIDPTTGIFDSSLYENGSPYDGTGGLGTNLDDIYNTTGDTAYNTAQMADSLDASEEELKLLREIAERQVINKFTTAKVVLDFTGMTNKIEGSEDLDGLVDRLAVRLEDVLYTVAEGVQI